MVSTSMAVQRVGVHTPALPTQLARWAVTSTTGSHWQADCVHVVCMLSLATPTTAAATGTLLGVATPRSSSSPAAWLAPPCPARSPLHLLLPLAPLQPLPAALAGRLWGCWLALHRHPRRVRQGQGSEERGTAARGWVLGVWHRAAAALAPAAARGRRAQTLRLWRGAVICMKDHDHSPRPG